MRGIVFPYEQVAPDGCVFRHSARHFSTSTDPSVRSACSGSVPSSFEQVGQPAEPVIHATTCVRNNVQHGDLRIFTPIVLCKDTRSRKRKHAVQSGLLKWVHASLADCDTVAHFQVKLNGISCVLAQVGLHCEHATCCPSSMFPGHCHTPTQHGRHHQRGVNIQCRLRKVLAR
jgi:hypothetical protein